jgi:hypothetical protein
LERFDKEISFNTSGMPRGKRLAYSFQPVCTQAGIRWPTAATVSCMTGNWSSG